MTYNKQLLETYIEAYEEMVKAEENGLISNVDKQLYELKNKINQLKKEVNGKD